MMKLTVIFLTPHQLGYKSTHHTFNPFIVILKVAEHPTAYIYSNILISNDRKL